MFWSCEKDAGSNLPRCALDSEYEAEKPTEYLIDLGMHPQNSPVKHHSSLEEGSDDSFSCH